ncbi:RC-LH1 core complex protein PufX [Pseudopelagicola sp. nBUS_19]|uniref:RC-LH1 core complex protein PufX n=1 Tax=unclassified Pseudopelagicola TaxID=2649563 RepID=UPI003EBCC27B
MSENHEYLMRGESRRLSLSGDVLSLMLKGAGYAAIVCLTLWFLISAMFWLGSLLPDEARETEDPTPYSYYINHTYLV